MASYERDYQLLGIALPDELFGMFDTADVLRRARWYVLAILLLLALVGVIWAVQYERADRERSERFGPVWKAQAEVGYLENHHGTEEEVCAARQALVKAENEARIGDGNDLDHLSARTCALNLELERRLETNH